MSNRLWVSLCLAATLVVAGCAGGTVSPTAPTVAAPAPLAPAPHASGATITGIVTAVAPSAVTVSVVGTDLSGSVDVSGHFALSDVPAIDVVLNFTGPDVNATLPIGSVAVSDEIRLTVTLSGNSATLDNQQRTNSSQFVDLEGSIDSIDLSGRRLMVNATSVYVPTSATIRRGDAPIEFSDLKVGEQALVRGTKDGEIVVATEVFVRVQPPPPPPPPPERIYFSGNVVGFDGTCPSLRMKVGNVYVRTDGATTFAGKGCSGVAVGSAVGGHGTKGPDGLILAARLEVN